THGPASSWGGGPSAEPSGCPERNRDSSDLGPAGPIVFGVWHAPQPMAATRYLPRWTRPLLGTSGVAGARPNTAATSVTPTATVIPLRNPMPRSFIARRQRRRWAPARLEALIQVKKSPARVRATERPRLSDLRVTRGWRASCGCG